MSSLLALTLRNLWKSINLTKVIAFWEFIWCGVWDTTPSKSSQRTGIQSTMLGEAEDLPRALPWVWCGASLHYLGDLGHSSCILATRASSVYSAEKGASRWFRFFFVGKFSLGSVYLCVGCVKSVGSSEHNHRVRWTQGSLFSTKHKHSFFFCSALHLNIISFLPLADCAFMHWIFSLSDHKYEKLCSRFKHLSFQTQPNQGGTYRMAGNRVGSAKIPEFLPQNNVCNLSWLPELCWSYD